MKSVTNAKSKRAHSGRTRMCTDNCGTIFHCYSFVKLCWRNAWTDDGFELWDGDVSGR